MRTGYAQVDVDMLTEAADVDSLYEEALLNLKHRKPVDQKTKGPSVTEQEQNAKDYYANVRTNVREQGILLSILVNKLWFRFSLRGHFRMYGWLPLQDLL